MPLKHVILDLSNCTEMTGYDTDYYPKSSIVFFWRVQTSQIYKELNTCTKHNWADGKIAYQSDKLNKKVFHIIDEERLELNRWLADVDLEDIMKHKNPLLIEISLPSNIDIDKTMRLLEKYTRECSDTIDKMNEDLDKIPEFEAQIYRDNESFYWGMTMTYGFAYYRNETKWANWRIDKLKEKIG